MTNQDAQLLAFWQLQRQLGVKPADRRLPANDRDSFERDLEIIRQVIERKS